MIATEPRCEAPRKADDDDATSAAPLIINGLSVRRRDKAKLNIWSYVGILFLPDIVLLFVIVALGMHRFLRYLDAKGSPNVAEERNSQSGE
jgi:hypothetical protein